MGDRQYNRNKYTPQNNAPVKTSGNRVLPNGSIFKNPKNNTYFERK